MNTQAIDLLAQMVMIGMGIVGCTFLLVIVLYYRYR